MNLALLLLPAISLVLVAALLKLLLTSGLASRIALDVPNARSLHATPIPRIGGIVLIAVAAAAIAVALPTLRSIALLAGALMLVSAWDDRRGSAGAGATRGACRSRGRHDAIAGARR